MHVHFYFTIEIADESRERLIDAPMFSGSIIDKPVYNPSEIVVCCFLCDESNSRKQYFCRIPCSLQMENKTSGCS